MPVLKEDTTDASNHEPPIALCPVEVLALIFEGCDSLFDRLRIGSVCRLWRSIIRDYLSSKKATLDLSVPYRGYLGGIAENSLLRALPAHIAESVTTLCLDNLDHISDYAIHSLLYQCVNVEIFLFRGGDWRHYIVLDLNMLPKLKFADLRESSVRLISDNKGPRLHLAAGSSTSRSVDLTGSGFRPSTYPSYMRPSHVGALFTDRLMEPHRDLADRPAHSGRPVLTGLTTDGAQPISLTAEALRALTSYTEISRYGVFANPISRVGGCRSLTSLSVHHCKLREEKIGFLKGIADRLTHLDLSSCTIHMMGFAEGIVLCTRLQTLILRRVDYVMYGGESNAEVARDAIGKVASLTFVDITRSQCLAGLRHPTAKIVTDTPLYVPQPIRVRPVPEAEMEDDRVAPPTRGCTLATYGCDWRGPCKDATAHLVVCTFNQVCCTMCRQTFQRSEMARHLELHMDPPYYTPGRIGNCPCCRITLRADPPDQTSLNAQLQRHLLVCPRYERYLPPLTATKRMVPDTERFIPKEYPAEPYVNPRDVAVNYKSTYYADLEEMYRNGCGGY